jgi:preprotein translocase SecE subunit
VRTLVGTLPPEPDPIPGRPQRHLASVLQFMREVRGEVGKINWPLGSELLTYSRVTAITVAAMTGLIFGLDVVLSKGLLRILR